jgi:hypothetical protein
MKLNPMYNLLLISLMISAALLLSGCGGGRMG